MWKRYVVLDQGTVDRTWQRALTLSKYLAIELAEPISLVVRSIEDFAESPVAIRVLGAQRVHELVRTGVAQFGHTKIELYEADDYREGVLMHVVLTIGVGSGPLFRLEQRMLNALVCLPNGHDISAWEAQYAPVPVPAANAEVEGRAESENESVFA